MNINTSKTIVELEMTKILILYDKSRCYYGIDV